MRGARKSTEIFPFIEAMFHFIDTYFYYKERIIFVYIYKQIAFKL